MPTNATSLPHCARRQGKGPVLALVVTVALTGAACSSPTHTPPSSTSRTSPVLGEQAGMPLVVGQPAPAGTGDLSAVSCANADHCWAVGVPGPNAGTTSTASVTVIAATTNGGRTWAAQAPGLSTTPALTGVSCPSAKVCMAVGSTGSDPGTPVVVTTDNGGTDWAQATPPAGAIIVSSVQCSTTSNCVALVSNGATLWSASTVNFGRSWQQEGTLPAGLEDAQALWCGAGGTCLVAGSVPTTSGHAQGAVALSTDGGKAWAAATVPAGVGLLQGATCATAVRCLVAGTTSTTLSAIVPAKGELLVSTDGGRIWAASPTPPVDDVFALQCPGVTSCAMVGTDWHGSPVIGAGAVAESTDGGATFAASTTAYTPLTLTALACPAATRCVAAGGDTLARISLPTPTSHTH